MKGLYHTIRQGRFMEHPCLPQFSKFVISQSYQYYDSMALMIGRFINVGQLVE
jgi:hypothetical protein